MNYYTYAYLREDGTPYYIGKGKAGRINNKLHTIHLPPEEGRRIFLKQNLTDEEARKHEVYMIAVLGRKDLGTGILRNLTNGGEGTSGFVMSEETKRKIGEKQRGEENHNYGKIFPVETRKKMSENQMGEKNNFYGKTHTLETKQKISKKSKGRTLSLEARQKISKVHKGKNISVETIEKFRDNFKKKYYLISPIGEMIEEYDTFCGICKKYNLDVSALLRVKNGKQKQHKGWTFLKKDDKVEKIK